MEVEHAQNGGFPEPLAGEPVRLVRCRHETCGTSTRVRVPRALPALAVRRVVCEECRQPFACEADDGGVVAAVSVGRSWSQGRAWKYLSIPLAAAAVIVALILIQGSGGSDQPSSTTPAAPNDADAGRSQAAGGAAASGQGGGELVRGSSYTLALPDGWTRTEPESGATFAAEAEDGGAQATLWVRSDPDMSFPEFESQSLSQLRQVAGSAQVVERTAAPTVDASIVTIAANHSSGGPDYQAVLRAAGPYRYYLSTTVEPEASKSATQGAELIRNSFVPVTP
jgi:hypothetical protein